MNSKQLEQFVVIAEEENLTRAGKRLFVSQTALSHVLKQLEEELGCPLFDRQGNRLLLNEKGTRLLHYARKMKHLLTDAYRDITNMGTVYPLEIFSTSEVYFTILCKSFAELGQRYNFFMRKMPWEEITRRMREKENVIAIVPELDVTDDFFGRCLPIMEEHLLINVPSDHRWANKSRIEIEELADEEFAYITNSETQNWAGKLVEKRGKELAFAEQISSFLINVVPPESVRHPIIATNLGYELGISVQKKNVRSVIAVRGEGTTRKILLCYHKNVLPIVQNFIDTVQESLRYYTERRK